jgi:hypothetical protein
LNKIPGIAGVVDIGEGEGGDVEFNRTLNQVFCAKAVTKAEIGFAVQVHPYFFKAKVGLY